MAHQTSDEVSSRRQQCTVRLERGKVDVVVENNMMAGDNEINNHPATEFSISVSTMALKLLENMRFLYL
jgi:hypothetical protein